MARRWSQPKVNRPQINTAKGGICADPLLICGDPAGSVLIGELCEWPTDVHSERRDAHRFSPGVDLC